MGELKKKLIAKIKSTNDEGLLREAYRLLSEKQEEMGDQYILSQDQEQAISEAQEQIRSGDYLSDKQVKEASQEWFRKK